MSKSLHPAVIPVCLIAGAVVGGISLMRAGAIPDLNYTERAEVFHQALTGAQQIPALDGLGRPATVRFGTVTSSTPGPCLRETISAAQPGRQRQLTSFVRFLCLFDVTDTEAGTVRVMARTDRFPTGQQGSSYARALSAEEIAVLLPRIAALPP